jgi:hypothetical protein
MKIAAVTFAAISLCVLPSAAAESGAEVYEKGRRALEKGDLVTARQCFEKLLAANPNFDLALAQLAQVAVLEKKLARIPVTLKTARAQRIDAFAVHQASLEETIRFFCRKLEQTGGAKPLTVNVTGVLPEAVNERPVTINAREATYDHVLQAVGFAADVSFSYLSDGIAVATERGAAEFPAGNAKEPTLQAAAAKLDMGRLELHDADVSEAFTNLAARAAKVGGGQVKPFFVIRHDCTPRRGVTLDLRNVSLEEAVRAVCLVADLEETWFPWGAGIGNPRPKAVEPVAVEKAETPDQPKR